MVDLMAIDRHHEMPRTELVRRAMILARMTLEGLFRLLKRELETLEVEYFAMVLRLIGLLEPFSHKRYRDITVSEYVAFISVFLSLNDSYVVCYARECHLGSTLYISV